MDSISRAELCEEYIIYGARCTIAQIASNVSRKQAKKIYDAIIASPSPTGRLPTRWSAFLRRSHEMAVPSQKFLGIYHAQCGNSIFVNFENRAVLTAYKAYLAINAQDAVLIDLSLAWTLARSIAQQEDGCDVRSCKHCRSLYLAKNTASTQCWICKNAQSVALFELPITKSLEPLSVAHRVGALA
jgi:hypothetical protein